MLSYLNSEKMEALHDALEHHLHYWHEEMDAGLQEAGLVTGFIAEKRTYTILHRR